MSLARSPAPLAWRPPGRRDSAGLYQEPPRRTRRRQSPSQQSSVHSHTFPTMSNKPAPLVGAVGADRARGPGPRPLLVAAALGVRGRPIPLRLGRQAIRSSRYPAQPRHVRLPVVPTHARHRVPVRLSKARPATNCRPPRSYSCRPRRHPSLTRTPGTPPPSPRSDLSSGRLVKLCRRRQRLDEPAPNVGAVEQPSISLRSSEHRHPETGAPSTAPEPLPRRSAPPTESQRAVHDSSRRTPPGNRPRLL